MDSGVREGDEISMFYDPMIAKLITHGKDRNTALDVHGEALDRFHIEGIQDNIPFIAAVMDEKRFRSGNITTAYIKDEFPDGFDGVPPTKTQETQLICTAAYVHGFLSRRAAMTSGRMSPLAKARRDWVVVLGDGQHPVTLDLDEDDGAAEITINGGKPHKLETGWTPGQHVLTPGPDLVGKVWKEWKPKKEPAIA